MRRNEDDMRAVKRNRTLFGVGGTSVLASLRQHAPLLIAAFVVLLALAGSAYASDAAYAAGGAGADGRLVEA